MKISRVQMKRKKSQLIIANGSERGEYIPLEHVFSQFDRIHDGVQLMKTYYPYDESWSTNHKISEVTKKKGVTYAWDYEYEDYHPFDIWSENSNTRKELEEIKQYGADVHLTLTMDLSLDENEIRRIAESLRGYGRIYLRINHEMNGSWFRYNTQHSFKEANDFFVKCHHIMKQANSNIYTVFNLSGDAFVVDGIVKAEPLYLEEEGLKEALMIADYWSIDKYTSLHYGWPFEDVPREKMTQYFQGTIKDWWSIVEEMYIKMIWKNGLVAKPLFINEFNSDSDIDGEDGQAEIISSIYKRFGMGEFEWLEGIVLYQFRDFGGLGLEKGNKEEYKQMPALKSYREAIREYPYEFVEEKEWEKKDFTFSWLDMDHIRGMKIEGIEEKNRFQNQFDIPVYITWDNGTEWKRVNPGESIGIKDQDQVLLFLPPYKKDKNTFMYSRIIRDVKRKLEAMI